MKKTKIICTIGPSSSSPEMLEKLIKSGMDVARLNFSHGSHESHGEVIRTIRRLSDALGKPVALLQDLCGPKIRLGEIAGAPVTVNNGGTFTFFEDDIIGDATKGSITYKNLYREVHEGDRILIDDGLIEMKVRETGEGSITCEVVTGGPISSHKGVNLPGIQLSIPSLTEKDIDDLRFGLSQSVDLIAISFVRRQADLLLALAVMREEKKFAPLIAKIEKQEAVDNIEEILHYADGIMVARGDMGVELPFQEVPIIQKRLISLCRNHMKPVITATQMLDSMIRNPRPTRAEANDVANAILDGTDAVMLSGETASGRYPLEAVQAMATIAEYTENSLPYESIFLKGGEERNAVEAISLATCEIAEQMKARAIIISTSSGRTARAVSCYRPRQPIVAVTDSAESLHRMMLLWGVFPTLMKPSESTDRLFDDMCASALKTGLVMENDLAVITAGIPEGMKGSTNTIKLQVVGHQFMRGTGAGFPKSATGKVLLVESYEEGEKKLREGDILVIRRIDETLEGLMLRACAIIVEENNMLVQGGELLRKVSKPVVLGIPKVFEALHDGDIVTVDSERGLVYLGR